MIAKLEYEIIKICFSVMETALELGKAYCDAFNSPGVNGTVIATFYATDCRFMTPGVPTVSENTS